MRLTCVAWMLTLMALLPLAGSEPLAITYIANEGFLIEEGRIKVLIDALWKYSEPTFGNPGPELVARMQSGQKPFDGVQLVLVTHGDLDHFDAGLVTDYLRGNPQARLIAPAELVDEIRAQPLSAEILKRADGLSLARGETAERSVGAIHVTAIRLRHAPDRTTQNFAYLVRTGQRTFLHMADSTFRDNAEFINKLTFPKIDVAFLEQFDTSPASIEIVSRKIKPARIVPMHFYVDRIDKQAADFLRAYPGALVFHRQLERIELKD